MHVGPLIVFVALSACTLSQANVLDDITTGIDTATSAISSATNTVASAVGNYTSTAVNAVSSATNTTADALNRFAELHVLLGSLFSALLLLRFQTPLATGKHLISPAAAHSRLTQRCNQQFVESANPLST